MEPISNVDRIVILLRQKLEERAKAAGGSGSAKEASGPPILPMGIKALAALGDLDPRQLRRTFIQTLLADQLGAQLVNDAQFQQIVARVTDAIEGDSDASRLLTRLLEDLRSA